MTETEVKAFLAQFDQAREDFKNWPRWVQEAAVEKAATFPKVPFGVKTPGESPSVTVQWKDVAGVAPRDERAAFETWARPRGHYQLDRLSISGGYVDDNVQNLWRGWQARAEVANGVKSCDRCASRALCAELGCANEEIDRRNASRNAGVGGRDGS